LRLRHQRNPARGLAQLLVFHNLEQHALMVTIRISGIISQSSPYESISDPVKDV
jgi:hypothetical protein